MFKLVNCTDSHQICTYLNPNWNPNIKLFRLKAMPITIKSSFSLQIVLKLLCSYDFDTVLKTHLEIIILIFVYNLIEFSWLIQDTKPKSVSKSVYINNYHTSRSCRSVVFNYKPLIVLTIMVNIIPILQHSGEPQSYIGENQITLPSLGTGREPRFAIIISKELFHKSTCRKSSAPPA